MVCKLCQLKKITLKTRPPKINERKGNVLNINRGWRRLPPPTNPLLHRSYFSMLCNRHKLLYKNARASLTRHVLGLGERRSWKKILLVEKYGSYYSESFGVRISDSAILQCTVCISVIAQIPPGPAVPAMGTAVLSSAQLFLSPGSLPWLLQVPHPGVSHTAFPSLCRGLFTYFLLHVHKWEHRSYLHYQSLGHGRGSVNNYGVNVVEWML